MIMKRCCGRIEQVCCPMTDPKDTAELVSKYRMIATNRRLAGLPDGDATATADAIQRLEGQVAELEKRTLMAETANIGYRMERDEDHATISRLREALEEIDGQAVCVGMAEDWNEASDMLVNVHMIAKKTLAREPSPDTGTSPEQVDPERLEFLRESFREFIQDHDADNPMNVNQTDDLVFIALSCLGLEKPNPEQEKTDASRT